MPQLDKQFFVLFIFVFKCYSPFIDAINANNTGVDLFSFFACRIGKCLLGEALGLKGSKECIARHSGENGVFTREMRSFRARDDVHIGSRKYCLPLKSTIMRELMPFLHGIRTRKHRKWFFRYSSTMYRRVYKITFHLLACFNFPTVPRTFYGINGICTDVEFIQAP